MSMDAAARQTTLSPFEQLRFAREILHIEGRALLVLAERLDQDSFGAAIRLIYECQGSVIVSGMGKAGLIGQKIVATLASTGTPSHFLHPGEAVHGDLGRVQARDIVLALSYSGETEEIVRLAGHLRAMQVPLIALTGRPTSQLARSADVTLDLGTLKEAGALGLAPSTSTTCMLALGDALALVVSRMRGFGHEDFARFHPGGSLGRKLAKVEEIMRPLAQCRCASEEQTVRQVYVGLSRPGRRIGAIMLTNSQGQLSGIFTDSDLARLLESNRDKDLDGPIRQVMTCAPKTVPIGTPLLQAMRLMADNRISELPVVNEQHEPVGMLDITDLVGLQPAEGTWAGDAGADETEPIPTVPFPHIRPGTVRR